LIKSKFILNPEFINAYVPVQEIKDPQIVNAGVKLFVKRDDLVHPLISGNKWYKLKYNLETAAKEKFDTLLTFGGAYSNHIYATAAAGRLFGFNTIGIIRGEEHLPLNATLSFAKSQGMKLHYVCRSIYREKANVDFVQSLKNEFGRFFLIPEGGTNELAVRGASEMVTNLGKNWDVYCCACGTGGSIAGIISGLQGKGKALGFSVLRGGGFFVENVKNLINDSGISNQTKWEINLNYHFGGYARINKQLVDFIDKFQSINQIPVEPIYTGKMFFGIYDLIADGYFKKGTSVLAIHTGGMQGLEGMKEKINKFRE